MTQVLLVYPKFPESFWGHQRALEFLGLHASHPPLGLLTVAGMLPQNCDAHLIDLNITDLRPADLAWADVVLTGGMMVQRPSVEWIIERGKEASVPVVVGGPDVTSSHEQIKGDPHFVLGEADNAEFAEAFDGMIASREQVILDLHDNPPDINASPLPRYDTIRLNQYAAMAMQVSRGCPFKCEFCDIPELFGKTTRYKSADKAIAELEVLYRQGWRGSIFWVDDNFIGNRKSAKLLLPYITQWQEAHDRPFRFYTQASVNLAGDDDLMAEMVEAGFETVFLGIETPIDASLRETKKLQNVKYDLLESVKKVQRFGMEVTAGFIIGFDNDPPDIDRHLINFIQDSGIPTAMAGLLTAVPGSPLYDRFKKESRLIHTSAVREGNNTFEFAFNFKTIQDSKVLIEAYKNVLHEIYGKPANYFKRVETLYAHLGKNKCQTLQFTFRRLWAFIKSILMIPKSQYGRAYGKFLVRTLFRKPSKFWTAVFHGIVGVHFHELTVERIAVHEFDGYVRTAMKRVQEACQRGRGEGLTNTAQVLADARKKLKALPSAIRGEMSALYEELEVALEGVAASSASTQPR